MGSVSLSDILVTPLARIAADGGDVMHALKNNDPEYGGFGEAYFSWLERQYPGWGACMVTCNGIQGPYYTTQW